MVDSVYSDRKAGALASTVLRKTLKVRAGENVTIETWSGTLPWATAFVLEARRIGARPVLLVEDEDVYWKSLASAEPKALGNLGRHEWALLERTNAYVFFWGPGDMAREMKLPQKTKDAMWAYEDRWFATANRAGLRLARLFMGRVTPASARMYGVDENAWRRELVEGALVDPEIMHRAGTRVAERLRTGREVHIQHPNGTDITLRLKHREPLLHTGILESRRRGNNGHGGMHAGVQDVNIPAGYATAALDEDAAEGRFVANGVGWFEDVRLRGGIWEFRNGRLLHYSYLDGRERFDRAYADAGRGRDFPGMLSIGLNPKMHMAPLMTDQGFGVVTLSIGANRYAGGTTETKNSFFSWLHLKGADLTIDGKPLVKKGRVL